MGVSPVNYVGTSMCGLVLRVASHSTLDLTVLCLALSRQHAGEAESAPLNLTHAWRTVGLLPPSSLALTAGVFPISNSPTD